MISRGSKQRAGQVNLRKREKTDGLLDLKTGARVDQPKRENGWIIRPKNRGQGGPTYGKKINKWISRG